MSAPIPPSPGRPQRRPWKAALRPVPDLAFIVFVLVSIASLLGPYWWGFQIVSEFREQLLVAGAGLAVLLALRPRTLQAVLAGALAGIHFVPVLPYYWDALATPKAAKAARDPAAIRLMTINTWRGRAGDAPVSKVIRDNAPAIVVVTEFARPPLETLAGLTDILPHRAGSPTPGIFELLLLSRHPIASVRWHYPVGPSAPVMEARICPDRGCFTVIALHAVPPHVERARPQTRMLETAGKLAGAVPHGRVVVIGDLNTTPYGTRFSALLEDGGLRDAARGYRRRPTWRSRLILAGLAIDHVLIGAGFDPRAARVLADIGSDHFPLLVDVAAAGNRPWIDLDRSPDGIR